MQRPQHQPRTERASNSGYSLVELVVVMVLFGVIALTSFFVVLESMRVYSRAQPRMEASYQVNLVADRLTRDIREIPSVQSIEAYGEEKLTFHTASGGLVEYGYGNGVLLRNGQTLAEGLQGFIFGFFTADEMPALTASDIHLVRLKLVAKRASETVPLALTVFPRGLQR